MISVKKRLTFGQMSNVLQEGMVVGHLIQIFLPQILPQNPDQQPLHSLQQFLQVSIVIGLQSKEPFLHFFSEGRKQSTI